MASDEVSLREHLERLIEERDRQYDKRFKYAEDAVALALAEKRREHSSIIAMVALAASIISIVVATASLLMRYK